MEATFIKLNSIMDEYLVQLKALSEDEWSYKPLPTKWSKKEIIGHLIDSAQNNLRRFIVAQYEQNSAITYDQDKWVAINDYQHQASDHIIQLWYLLNKQIAGILINTSAETLQHISITDTMHTIEWLASDYIKHMEHHVSQVLNLEPVAYP